jgi:magnesium-transporting ATPase (P-type)
MEIPVDGLLLRGSGILSSEAAMTGESDEMKKEPLEMCLQRKHDKDLENATSGKPSHGPHDLPSPILLSGA